MYGACRMNGEEEERIYFIDRKGIGNDTTRKTKT
jgi:hypothetical protein